MRIACPACNATYAVPDAQLSEARVVRCARCGTDWAPLDMLPPSDEPRLPEPVVEAPAPVAEPSLEAARMAIEDEVPVPVPVADAPTVLLPTPPVKTRTPVLLVVAWVVSVAAVIAGAAGLYVGRERVMAAWPPSVRAYAALRLAAHAPPVQHESEGRE